MPPAHSPRLVKHVRIHHYLYSGRCLVSRSTFPNLVAIRIGSTLTNCAIDIPFRRAYSNVFQKTVLAKALVVPSCKTGIG